MPHRHWRDSAKRFGLSHEASWADLPAIEMEQRQIAVRLKDGEQVLDVGCGNGFSTLFWAEHRRIRIQGVDAEPGMIRNARRRMKYVPSLKGRVGFAVGDIRALKQESGSFDKVVCVRVLINLLKAADRRRALKECARVLKPGGRLILSEAVLENWQRLNRFRREWELPAVPMPKFNRYLSEKEFLRLTKENFDLVESNDFSSTYFVGTRVLKPLLLRLMGSRRNAAEAMTHWNRWFSMLPAWGDYGTQKLFVLEKRG